MVDWAFLAPALAAGIGVALVAGPLGTFVVWRRMAYFGDTLAHSALLGIAAASAFSLPPGLAVASVCLAIAVGLLVLQQRAGLAADTLLGILSHSALALGLIAVWLVPGARLHLEGVLFGDLLAVGAREAVTVWLVGLSVLALLAYLWRPLLSLTVDQDLARVEGIPVGPVKTVYLLTLALVIAIAMRVVGVLLITALLVIPAATARRLARSPEAMAVQASLVGMAAVALGLALAWAVDLPAGPAVVVAAAALFLLSLVLRGK